MYYYLVFCILAGAGLVHLARRERSKPASAVRKAIPTRNDPWVWWARYLLALFVAAVLLALSGCYNRGYDPEKWIGLERGTGWTCTHFEDEATYVWVGKISTRQIRPTCKQWTKLKWDSK